MRRILSRKQRFQKHCCKKTRLSLVILWGGFLSLNIFTEDLETLLISYSLRFTWISTPNFLFFFNLYDFTKIHPWWLFVKFGHCIGFAILNLLLYRWIGSHRIAIIIAVTFAVLTELLQLFLGRDGRLYDVLIDSLGIALVYYFLKLASVLKSSIARIIK